MKIPIDERWLGHVLNVEYAYSAWARGELEAISPVVRLRYKTTIINVGDVYRYDHDVLKCPRCGGKM